MKKCQTYLSLLGFMISTFLCASAIPQRIQPRSSLPDPELSVASKLVNQAVHSSSSEAEIAISKLRAMGPKGLQFILKEYDVIYAKSKEGSTQLAQENSRYHAAIDAIAKQKYAYVSR